MTRKLRQTTARKRKSSVPKTSATAREVTRYISPTVTAVLWGRAAGRCEFAGCNEPLWKSPVTQEPVNIAERAHIYSFSRNGPRGNDGVADEDLNGCDNLLLVCHACHRKIDKSQDGGRYTVEVLRQMKADHEQRVETVTGVAADRRSHVLLYGANIGEQSSPLCFNDAAAAMFPTHYPATDQAIELGLANCVSTDRDAEYWDAQRSQLRRAFERRVRERVLAGDIAHLSIFAIAPQPLLILLGALLGDLVPATAYQRHREPPTWMWPIERGSEATFEVREPNAFGGPAALVLGLSATITPDRIVSVLGNDASIWMVTIASPHNDMLKSQQQLSDFRAVLRRLLDRIKSVHGQSATLHLFPAMPVAAAVEIGRVRMPKADMPWQLYDQVNARGGFIPALSLPQEQ